MASPERDALVADVLRVSPELALRVAEAIDALRSDVERQAGIIAALDRTVEELSGENVALRAALARVADCSSYASLCTACKDAVASALVMGGVDLGECVGGFLAAEPDDTPLDVRRAAAVLADEEEG